MNKIKLLKPTNDEVFPILFNPNNSDITKGFIEDLIGKKIKNISINSDKELQRNNIDNKKGILDLQVEIENNELIDVEIQIREKPSFENRLLFYGDKLFANSVKRGHNGYIEAKKTLIIAIIDYSIELTNNISDYITKYRYQEINHKFELTNMQEIDIIELPKIRKLKNYSDVIAQWMLFLDDPNSKEAQEAMVDNEKIKRAKEVLEEISNDPALQRKLDLDEKWELDRKTDLYAAESKGLEKR